MLHVCSTEPPGEQHNENWTKMKERQPKRPLIRNYVDRICTHRKILNIFAFNDEQICDSVFIIQDQFLLHHQQVFQSIFLQAS